MICNGCGKQVRAPGVTRAEAPGTVPYGRADTCQTCAKRRGPLAPTPATDDSACVLIRTNLRPSTYRVFAAHAKDLGVDVGELLSRIADRAVQPSGHRSRRTAGDDIDRRIRELNTQRLSDNRISAMIGLAQSSVSRRRRLMGLEPPAPRRGGRQKQKDPS